MVGLSAPSARLHRTPSKVEPAPTCISHRVTASFRHSPVLVWGPSETAGGYEVHHGSPWAVRGHPASPWSSPWAAEESLLWHLRHILLLLHWPRWLQGCFSHTFSLSIHIVCSHPSCSQICDSTGATSITDGLGLGQGLGLSWRHLVLAQSVTGKFLAVSLVPCNLNHVMQPEYTAFRTSSNMEVSYAELTGIWHIFTS